MTHEETVPLVADEQRRDVMKAPDEVSAMLRLKALGWGSVKGHRCGTRLLADDSPAVAVTR